MRPWDWKSIKGVLLVVSILGIMSLLFYYPDWKRKMDADKCTLVTQAFLIEIKTNKALSMGETGNTMVIHSYSVRFSYKVKKRRYESVDIIPNTIENKSLILRLQHSTSRKLKIKYTPSNPQKSIVIH